MIVVHEYICNHDILHVDRKSDVNRIDMANEAIGDAIMK
jgi:hypothetical protein